MSKLSKTHTYKWRWRSSNPNRRVWPNNFNILPIELGLVDFLNKRLLSTLNLRVKLINAYWSTG